MSIQKGTGMLGYSAAGSLAAAPTSARGSGVSGRASLSSVVEDSKQQEFCVDRVGFTCGFHGSRLATR